MSPTSPRDPASVARNGASVLDQGERADGSACLPLGMGNALLLGVPFMGVAPARPFAHVERIGRAKKSFSVMTLFACCVRLAFDSGADNRSLKGFDECFETLLETFNFARDFFNLERPMAGLELELEGKLPR